MPVISASMGFGLDMRKLLVYPVPHGKLFLVEVLLRLTTGVEMLMVLAGGTIGLLRNPPPQARQPCCGFSLAVLVFVLFNLLLASGMRSLLERLLSRRQRARGPDLFLLMLYVVPAHAVSDRLRAEICWVRFAA